MYRGWELRIGSRRIVKRYVKELDGKTIFKGEQGQHKSQLKLERGVTLSERISEGAVKIFRRLINEKLRRKGNGRSGSRVRTSVSSFSPPRVD